MRKRENTILGYTKNLNRSDSGQGDSFQIIIIDGEVVKFRQKGYNDLAEAVANYRGGYIPVKEHFEFIEVALQQECADFPEGAKLLHTWLPGETLTVSASMHSLGIEIREQEAVRLKELGLEYPFTEAELKDAWSKAPESIQEFNPFKTEEA